MIDERYLPNCSCSVTVCANVSTATVQDHNVGEDDDDDNDDDDDCADDSENGDDESDDYVITVLREGFKK